MVTKLLFTAKSQILIFKSASTGCGFVYTFVGVKIVWFGVGEVLGLRRHYNGVRLRFMVNRSTFFSQPVLI